MRSSIHYSAAWLVLPVLFAGVLLLFMAFVVGSAHGQEEGDGQETAAPEGEDGYGYVRSLPETAASPPSQAEQEAALEGALLAARLGAGWEDGEMLFEDLRLLVSSARAQLENYATELTRLEREGAAAGELARAKERHAEAEGRLTAFDSAAGSLRSAMIELGEAFRQLDAAGARR